MTLAATGGTTPLQNASLIRLRNPSPNATTGITFGGDGVSPDGTWAASIKENLFIAANATTIKVPACSAVQLTLGANTTK